MLLRPLFIKWQERYDIGLPLIDEQHRGIVSIINALYHLMTPDVGGHKMYFSILETIKNYSYIHFVTEEGLLAASGYPDLERHQGLHRKLMTEMGRLENDAGRGGATAVEVRPLLDFLKKWWLEHITREDRLYRPHLLAGDSDSGGPAAS